MKSLFTPQTKIEEEKCPSLHLFRTIFSRIFPPTTLTAMMNMLFVLVEIAELSFSFVFLLSMLVSFHVIDQYD